MRQHQLGGHVADGPDARYTGRHALVDLDRAALAELENLLLLNDTALIIKDGDTVGEDYGTDVADINGDGTDDIMVKLKNGRSFSVGKDSTTDIIGGYMSLKAYDSTFLPVRNIEINVTTVSATPVVVATDPETVQNPNQKQESMQAFPEMQADTSGTPDKATRERTVDYVMGTTSAILLSAAAYSLFKFKKWL